MTASFHALGVDIVAVANFAKFIYEQTDEISYQDFGQMVIGATPTTTTTLVPGGASHHPRKLGCSAPQTPRWAQGPLGPHTQGPKGPWGPGAHRGVWGAEPPSFRGGPGGRSPPGDKGGGGGGRGVS